MKPRWIVTGGVVMALLGSAIYYHYKPDEAAKLAATIGLTGLLAAIIGGLFTLWGAAYGFNKATFFAARQRHRDDFAEIVFDEWTREVDARRLKLENSFAATLSVTTPPASTFQIDFTSSALKIAGRYSFPTNRNLWERVPVHWPALGSAWREYETASRALELSMRRLIETIESSLPQDSPTFQWQQNSPADPAHGRKKVTRQLWEVLLQWAASGTRNRSPFAPASVRQATGTRWVVDFGTGNGIGGGTEPEAQTGANALNAAAGNQANLARLREVLAARDTSLKHLTTVADALEKVRFDRRLVGVCDFCPDAPNRKGAPKVQ